MILLSEIKYAFTDEEMDAIFKALTAKRVNRMEICKLLLAGKLNAKGGEHESNN